MNDLGENPFNGHVSYVVSGDIFPFSNPTTIDLAEHLVTTCNDVVLTKAREKGPGDPWRTDGLSMAFNGPWQW